MRTNISSKQPPIFTHEGARAQHITKLQQLRRSVMATLLWEDQFYEDGVQISQRIADLIAELPIEDVAPLAIEAREQMYLRHIPLFIVREMARKGGERIIGDTLARVIQRPDELAEFLAIYWKDKRQPLSAQVKRGLALAFTKFNAYSLAKYNRENKIKLRDVLFLVHAKPKDEEQDALWKQLINDTLPIPDTWEVAISACRTSYEKCTRWTRLLEDDKLGGLALLRNLRNMLQAGVDRQTIRQAINRNAFKYVLPFRFIAAAKYAPELEPELETAMFRATTTLPKLSGKTSLLVDHSGSMEDRLSTRSELSRFDTACALAILLREVCEDVDIIPFSTEPIRVPPRRGFALVDVIRQCMSFGSTHTENAKLLADQYGYDRIIIVTDEQSHQALSAPHGIGYVINVASNRNGIGYGAWTHIDGWSENVVRYISMIEGEEAEFILDSD